MQKHSLYSNCLLSPVLAPQSAYGYTSSDLQNELLIKHLVFIFKIYTYYSRDIEILSVTVLKAKITKLKKPDKEKAKINIWKMQY